MNGIRLPTLCAALLLPPMAAAQGKVSMTTEEALKLAFPGCEVERKSVYLDEKQTERIAELAGGKFEKRLVFQYVATTKGKLVGTAYFDAHRVRTKREVLMVVVSPKNEIERVEVLAFAEPTDYLPRDSWYEQFPGRPLEADLRLNQGIKGVTGATMTARATTEAARRILAMHSVIASAPRKSKARPADATEEGKTPPASQGTEKKHEGKASAGDRTRRGGGKLPPGER